MKLRSYLTVLVLACVVPLIILTVGITLMIGVPMRFGERVAIVIELARLPEAEHSARASAEEVNNAKDQFVAALSHELRVPLTSIMGWLPVLRKEGADPAEKRNIVLDVGIDTAVTLHGDAARLQQVIGNLLNNALKFTPEKGRETVRVTEEFRDAIISVSDTGKRIRADFLPFVFDPFRQADDPYTRKPGSATERL